MKKCSHCQNSFSLDALQKCIDEGEELYFCCNGCKSVYFLLKDTHTQSFYSKLKSHKLTPAKEVKGRSFDYYDEKNFLNQYSKNQDSYKQITFLIHHIHCSACIWLNETMLYKLQGVIEVNINYTNHYATILWNPEEIKLSEIIQTIYQLGYEVSIGDQIQKKKKQEEELFFTKLIVAIFCTMNIMWIAVAQYSGYFQGIEKEYSLLLNLASLILCTPVLLFSGSVFYVSAWRGLRIKRVSMDLLVFSGSLMTYCYSIYATCIGKETYFESVSMILTFILLGKFLENKSKEKADEALQSLSSLIHQNLRTYPNQTSLSPQEVKIGTTLEVFAGEKIIIDGILQTQEALVDESSLSGESTPIHKTKGEILLSGSINLSKNLIYKTSQTFEQSTLNTLIELVQKAQSSKPQIQKMANAISSYFSQTILCIALITFLTYLALHTPFDHALSIAVSVIIIACPCALALATPIANIVGLNKAYFEGIIFKEGRFLETLAKIDCVCFDKTGTLTLGKPKITKEIKFSSYDSNLLSAFLQKNIHPIAQGILQTLPQSTQNYEITDFSYFHSQGVIAKHNQDLLLGGQIDFLQENGVNIPPFSQESGSIFAFAINQELQSIFFLQDCIKPSAKTLIHSLSNLGIEVFLLSGDQENEVQRISKELGIANFFFKHTPKQKAEVIKGLQGRGKCVAMIGDGINDALALKISQIGISIADKSDLAIENSDVILLQDKMLGILKAFLIAKKTYTTIKENILFSLIYNGTTIPLAVLGYISPIFAALSMSLSSLCVIFNSLRIKRFSPPISPKP